MQISEIRQKETSVLEEELKTLEQTRFDISMKSVVDKEEVVKVRSIKKDIAKHLTVLNERKKQNNG
jgi:ribosomal protein L29